MGLRLEPFASRDGVYGDGNFSGCRVDDVSVCDSDSDSDDDDGVLLSETSEGGIRREAGATAAE